MAESNVRHICDPMEYVPNTTLGRSGYQKEPADRMATLVEQLDALLILVTVDTDDDDLCGFNNCNSQIQRAVLGLAADMATEVHEIHKKLSIERFNSSHATQKEVTRV